MPPARVRDTSELVWPAVAETLSQLDLKPEDAALKKLAERYAQVIDQSGRHCPGCDSGECRRESYSWAARWIFPLLMEALEQLGATPAARARLTKGGKPGDGKPNRLAQLRAARDT